MTLSLVITTFNRSEVLGRLLARLEEQDDRDFQVVVAIDGSTDDTISRLSKTRTSYDLKWTDTRFKGYGLALARNMGIRAADGQAVVILDDDSVPEPGLVRAHKETVASGIITGGPRPPAEPGNERMAWKMRELARLPARTPLEIGIIRRDWPNAYLVENNICLLRDDFISLGLFSERLRLYGFIGQEFFARAQHLGWRYQYNPAAVAVHHGELVGNNGFEAGKKNRQKLLSDLIRPSLMTPRHYRAQVDWAAAYVNGLPADMPPFRLHAALATPKRAAGIALQGVRRLLRNLVPRV